MPVVTVCGEQREYPKETLFLDIASDYQEKFEDDILLVRANGKLRELHKTLHGDAEISFLTARDPAGQKTYERSAVFLMLKAFYDVLPNEKIRKIQSLSLRLVKKTLELHSELLFIFIKRCNHTFKEYYRTCNSSANSRT